MGSSLHRSSHAGKEGPSGGMVWGALQGALIHVSGTVVVVLEEERSARWQ